MANYSEILDYILKRTIENKNIHLQAYEGADFKSKNVVTSKEVMDKFGIEEFEVDIMRYELTNNSYINPHTGNITLKGIEFYNSGGFTQQKKANVWKVRKDQVYAWAVGTGTAIGGLYALYQLISAFSRHGC